jgi:RNA polymerase sigma factor (sigma-70 family)
MIDGVRRDDHASHERLQRFVIGYLERLSHLDSITATDAATDAVGDTFVHLSQTPEASSEELSEHMLKAIWRYAKRAQREIWRKTQLNWELPDAASAARQAAETADAEHRKDDLRGMLFVALQSLSPSQRSVADLIIRDNKTMQQIAQELGISEPAVRQRWSRAVKRLRELTSAELVKRTTSTHDPGPDPARRSVERKLREAYAIAMRDLLFDLSNRPKGAPLSCYFDLHEFSTGEIVEIIALLSDLYRSVGGDALVIDGGALLGYVRLPITVKV